MLSLLQYFIFIFNILPLFLIILLAVSSRRVSLRVTQAMKETQIHFLSLAMATWMAEL